MARKAGKGVIRSDSTGSVGARIRHARLARGFTPIGLARAVAAVTGKEVRGQSVHQWESGASKGPNKINLIAAAKVLAVREAWIVNGEEPSGLEPVLEPPRIGREVPLLTTAEILDGARPEAAPLLRTHFETGPAAVALRLSGRALEPRLPAGSLVVIDPGVAPEPGSLIAARVGRDLELGQLIIERTAKGRTMSVRPLAPDWPASPIRPEDIFGTIVEATLLLPAA